MLQTDFSLILQLFLEVGCLLVKLFIFYLFYKHSRSLTNNWSSKHLSTILLTGIVTNIVLIIYRLGCPPFDFFQPYFFRAVLRFENAAYVLQVYALFLFACNFTSTQGKKFPDVFKWFTLFSMMAALCWGSITYWTKNVFMPDWFWTLYGLWGVALWVERAIIVYIMYCNYKKEPLNLLQYHLGILTFYYIIPYCILKTFESDFLSPARFIPESSLRVNLFATTLTSLWLTAIIFYCARKLMGIRFLNMDKQVMAQAREKFDHSDLRDALSRVNLSDSTEQLELITKTFFEKTFSVGAKHVSLIPKSKDLKELIGREGSKSHNELLIEQKFGTSSNSSQLVNFVEREKIIIRDEVEFSHFYEDSVEAKSELFEAAQFIQSLGADIFVPIYYNNQFNGALVIDHGSRPNRFFTDMERNMLIIYADFLGSVLYFNRMVNPQILLQEKHALEEKLYSREQSENLLRKSIYSFITSKKRDIALLTYKNRRFSYINDGAKSLLNFDVNLDKGLEVTQKLSSMASEVATFFNSKRAMIGEKQGEELMVSIAPNLDKTNTIVTITQPTVTDFVRDSIEYLNDHAQWNFLLALRTTPEGTALNKLLPCDTQTFLNIKVAFLEYAATRKNMLFEMLSEDDSLAFAHSAHAVNHRTLFEEVVVDYYKHTDEELGRRLFGINPVLDQTDKKCLFEMLDKEGTLYIRNIHLLSMNLQKKFLNYLKTGTYTPLKSDQPKTADLILICSTDQNLTELTAQGKFLAPLFEELQKSMLKLPSLMTVSKDEVRALSEGIHSQVIKSKMYKNILLLTEVDHRKIAGSPLIAIRELRARVQHLVFLKTKRDSFPKVDIIDTTLAISDLDLATAARLGKAVLRDPKMLAMLLKKFNDSQAKVAQFLGVNRSSVHRRCIQYNLKTSD